MKQQKECGVDYIKRTECNQFRPVCTFAIYKDMDKLIDNVNAEKICKEA